MFRSVTAALAICTVATSVSAQEVKLDTNIIDPRTHLSAEKWINLATHILNATPLVGKDSVYMVNATGETLVTVVCRGYQLVGPKPYITSNRTTQTPSNLPAWTVTLIPTEGFNTYCKDGVDAQGAVDLYHGAPNSADKSFSNSTFVIFRPKE